MRNIIPALFASIVLLSGTSFAQEDKRTLGQAEAFIKEKVEAFSRATYNISCTEGHYPIYSIEETVQIYGWNVSYDNRMIALTWLAKSWENEEHNVPCVGSECARGDAPKVSHHKTSTIYHGGSSLLIYSLKPESVTIKVIP
jgi:hypothetical protein